jgi:type IV pilus assembly protein PilV
MLACHVKQKPRESGLQGFSNRSRVGKASLGVGMVEFIVALTVFTTLATALLTTQLTGKRLLFDAMQRSQAVEMANDMLRRIQSNSLSANAYADANTADPNQVLTAPGTDCRSSECTSAQMAAYDLWQWERELRGALQRRSGEWVGGLLSPLACIREEGGVVTVVVSWEGVGLASYPARGLCDLAGVGEGDSRRQEVVASGLVGAHS